MQITVAEALVRCLEQEKVQLIFGYPGGNITNVYDALYNSAIKHVLTRHEQGAIHAAEGYARATGKVGVCLATSGPGATNLVTGIANAYMDSVPLVVITGQVPVSQIGTDAFQEVDITGITIPVSKHNFLIKDPKQLPLVVKKAFYIAASGRPGPVLIDLPKDVAQALIKFSYPKSIQMPGYKPNYKGHPAMISQVAKIIQESARPLIHAGGGVKSSGASQALLELAETINAPVTHTLMGLGCFPGEHPLFMGMLGLHGTRYANKAVTECDCLITVGARFGDRVVGNIEGFAPNAKIIHIDIDPAEISKNVPALLPIVGDVKQVLEALLPLLNKKKNAAWVAQVQAWKKAFALTYSKKGALKPQSVIEKLYEVTKGEATVVTDVGQHQMWTAHYYKFKDSRSFISSGGLGAMGFGLPAAVGAQMGLPNRKTVLVTGDGSIQMTIQELATIAEQGLPIKIIVLNNRQLGMVRQLQEYYFEKRYMAVKFKFDLDFAALARVYGLAAYTVKNETELNQALPEALANDGPVLVNCLISDDENVLPMVLSGASLAEAIV